MSDGLRRVLMAGPLRLSLRTWASSSSPARKLFWQWGSRWDPLAEVKATMRNMERQMYRFDRRPGPFEQILSRPIPVSVMDTFRVDIYLNGFKPEEIKVTVKDRELSINAKMEKEAHDGGRISQELTRKYSLPEDLDASGLKSYLAEDGMLTIKASLPDKDKPKEIPISHEEVKKA